MSLQLALSNALSGLNVNQAALSVVSNNIANANTPGYSRQIIDQSALTLDGVGAGARIDAISRKVDIYLERSIQRETSGVKRHEKVADFYERVQILLGEPGSSNSIDEYIQSYFTSLQDLAETPDLVSVQANAVDTAEVLARELSGLAGALEDLRYQADQDIAEATRAVNTQIRHLDSLNTSIERANALNLSTASLLDERDMALEKIASYLDIGIYYKESGAVNIFTASGVALVDNEYHELAYREASGLAEFIENTPLNPLQVHTYDDNGNRVSSSDLILGGVEDGVVSRLKGGSIEGLRELRDELIPDILEQLDTLAAGLRDAVNAVHNNGSGYPPADSLTGTRLVAANERFDWSGTAQIAIFHPDGSPAESYYENEEFGYRPLTLNFDELDANGTNGVVDVQTIIKEINNHFNAPPVKASLGNLNNIQIVSGNTALPSGAPNRFTFDLDLENIANFGTDFWVTGVTVADDNGAQIASTTTGEVTDTIPGMSINSYNFSNGESRVDVNTATEHGLQPGDRVYLENPGGGPYAGINAAQLGGYFTVTSVNSPTSFKVTLSSAATADAAGVAPATAVEAKPPYQEVEAGEKTRTKGNGRITADLSANSGSDYFDITVNVGSFNEDPNSNAAFQSGTLTYRIYNNNRGLYNDRYDVQSVGGNATRLFPATPHQYIFARLVDENGVELPSNNGDYGNQSGFLELVANNSDGREYTFAINEGTSRQEGKQTGVLQAEAGTNRGFSHYFELNNFFVSNEPTDTGDTRTGSAINMAVERRLLDNPSLISTGQFEPTNPAPGENAPRPYSVERHIGNNTIAQQLAKISSDRLSFGEAGGLPSSTQTLNGYAGEMLGFIATKTVMARSTFTDADTLLQGLVMRSDAISGVNLDEELASTTLYQNAYSASARVISVTNELFDALFSAFN